MTIRLVPSALEHLSSEELARLSALWRAQASTGQVEAREIAKAFADELLKRFDARWNNCSEASSAEIPSKWWKLKICKIFSK